MKKRYEVGLDKLQLAEGEVGVMQKELNGLQPQLVTASKEVSNFIKRFSFVCLSCVHFNCVQQFVELIILYRQITLYHLT